MIGRSSLFSTSTRRCRGVEAGQGRAGQDAQAAQEAAGWWVCIGGEKHCDGNLYSPASNPAVPCTHLQQRADVLALLTAVRLHHRQP